VEQRNRAVPEVWDHETPVAEVTRGTGWCDQAGASGVVAVTEVCERGRPVKVGRMGPCYTLTRSAGSLGDRMRTPALMRGALGQIVGPPFILPLNPCRPWLRITAASRALVGETPLPATVPALTAPYGRRPDRFPDGHIRWGGAG
jgi:hypothetical protein